jgi:uncharacterized protein
VTDATAGPREVPPPEPPPGLEPEPEPQPEPAHDEVTGAGPVVPAGGPAADPAEGDPAEGVLDEAVPDEPGPDTGTAAGDFRMALVSSVTVELPNQHPSVVLRESESPRRQLTFSIALPDAVVLAHALRRISTPRPLTHELLSDILQGFDVDVVAVRLVGRQGAVYFAELDLRGRTGRSVFSCRPSDALTVALLQPVPVPILIDRRLFEQVGDVTPPGPA